MMTMTVASTELPEKIATFTCNSRNMSKLKNTPPNKKLNQTKKAFSPRPRVKSIQDFSTLLNTFQDFSK